MLLRLKAEAISRASLRQEKTVWATHNMHGCGSVYTMFKCSILLGGVRASYETIGSKGPIFRNRLRILTVHVAVQHYIINDVRFFHCGKTTGILVPSLFFLSSLFRGNSASCFPRPPRERRSTLPFFESVVVKMKKALLPSRKKVISFALLSWSSSF